MSERPWWRRRRTIVVASLVALLVAIRVALPYVLRAVLESQASALLAGNVSIANVDLWLAHGAVAVEGVELVGDRPARAETPPAGTDPGRMPRVAFRRLLLDISWWPLFSRTVEIDEIALDGPEIDVERLPDGTVILPQLRPPDPSAPPAMEEPEPEAAAPWNVVVTAARLRDGKLVLDDRVPAPPQVVSLSLDGLDLFGFRLLHDAEDESPGKGAIEARFGDGTVKLETSLDTRPEGFAVMATLTLDDVPLDRLNVHAPEIGWSDFRGRLDGEIGLHLEPDGLPIVWGTAALRDVQVDVPDLDEPALAWRRFDVDLERLDVAKRTVAVRRVALEGAGGLVRPLATPPLPLLAGLARAAAEEADAEGAPAADDAASTGEATGAGQAAPGAAPAPPAAEWSWSVATAEITDSLARVFLEPPPLELGIGALRVEGLSSAPSSRATVSAELSEGSGKATIAGDFALAPLAATLQIAMQDFAIERYASAVGLTPPVLRRGRLGADLKLGFGGGPATVSGEVSIADLDVAPPEGEDFALAWQRLEIGIREVRVPGLLSPPGEAVAGPTRADLILVALTEPKIRLTRTADGLAFPAVSLAMGAAAGERAAGSPAVAAGASAAEPAAPATQLTPTALPTVPPTVPVPPEGFSAPPAPGGEPAPAGAATTPVELTLGELVIDRGEISVVDRAVQPFYRGRLSAIELDAHDLAYPEGRFRDAHLTAKAPGGTPIEVRARQTGKVLEVSADTEGLALPPLNPYVAGASGYSIASGRFTLTSKLRLDERGYTSESQVAFDDLDVAGAEGDSLFADRFGVPLSLALALLRDVSGRIALTVPVSGDRSGSVRPDIAPIVAEALSRAVINALASPLKLLGALTLDGGKVAAFAPEPIRFRVGSAEVADEAWWRIEQLTGVLAASPALAVALTGAAGPDDLRALQEAAVLADLQQDQGFFATLRNLPSRGTRNAIRDALVARAAGEPATLDEEQSAQLDEWIAAKAIGEAELRTLAAARQERLRELLAADYGLGTERVVLRDAAPDAVAGKAEVAVEIAPRG